MVADKRYKRVRWLGKLPQLEGDITLFHGGNLRAGLRLFKAVVHQKTERLI